MHPHTHKHVPHAAHDHDAVSCCGADVGASPPPSFRGGRAYKVRGMDCAEEVAVLKRAVGPVVGGADRLAFDVLNGRMTVANEARDVSEESIIGAVGATGMTAVPWVPQAGKDETDRHRRQQVLFTAASGVCVLLGLVLHVWLSGGWAQAWKLLGSHAGQPTPWPEIAVYLAAIAFGARFVVVKAWYAARNLRPDMHLLMTVAVLGAIAIGEWFEAATVTFLFALSLALESWSVGRARAGSRRCSISRRRPRACCDPTDRRRRCRWPRSGRATASSCRPASASRSTAGSSRARARSTRRRSPAKACRSRRSRARTSSPPRSTATACSRSRPPKPPRTPRSPASSAWSRRRMRAARRPSSGSSASPASTRRPSWCSRSSSSCCRRWCSARPGSDWFYRALVLLVIACPCALVISTPVSIVAALACAARAGRAGQGRRLHRAAGAPPGNRHGQDRDHHARRARDVVRVVPLGNHTEAELIARAAALEARSTHPLARAILRHAERRDIAPAPATAVQALRGKGLTGTFDGEPFWLGSHRYVVERGHDLPEIARQAETLEADGKTVIVVGNARHVCGLIAVADTIRPQARALVAQLHAAGIAHVVMLTGDNRITAEAIAREVGIDEVHAELLPEDKVRKVEELVARYGTVAMVGDGVNDAPALARANLGIAMGAIGSDAAIETADIALMTDDISKLPWLVRHSRRTLADHPPEHRVLARRKGHVRGPDLCRRGEPLGGDCRRRGSIAARGDERTQAVARLWCIDHTC